MPACGRSGNHRNVPPSSLYAEWPAHGFGPLEVCHVPVLLVLASRLSTIVSSGGLPPPPPDGLTVMLRDADAVWPSLSVAVNPKLKVPVALATPEMVPVAEFSDSPGGNAPELRGS